MENTNIAFIGCGNMSHSLIGGLIANDVPTDCLSASDPDPGRRRTLSDQFGIRTSADNITIVTGADVIVLAVKPQVMRSVVKEVAPSFEGLDKLIISIAAGIRLDSISRWLGQTAAIIRVMPNTPALIQAGMTALFANVHSTKAQKHIAETLMRSVGGTIWLENEMQMDNVTALSGSGPAYFFYLMECMEKAAEGMGLDKAQARLLILETALGSAKMALLSSADPKTLRKQVTSPGGATEQALAVFTQKNLDVIVREAITAAARRAQALSEEFGE